MEDTRDTVRKWLNLRDIIRAEEVELDQLVARFSAGEVSVEAVRAAHQNLLAQRELAETVMQRLLNAPRN
jgi:hypothetical protein